MHDPSGRTDKLTHDAMARIERRLEAEPLSPTQRTAVWNSIWGMVYDNWPKDASHG